MKEKKFLRKIFPKFKTIGQKADGVLKEVSLTSQNLGKTISNANNIFNIEFNNIKTKAFKLEQRLTEELKSEKEDLSKKYEMIADRIVDEIKDKLEMMKENFLNEIDVELSNRENNRMKPLGPKNPLKHEKTGGGDNLPDKETNGNRNRMVYQRKIKLGAKISHQTKELMGM
ncbi:uncharacterized protein LOC141535005 [Cotesia typhae]|uniref:uncharacterized protein LOC141535005 n=1 Tax=Cotesia typhae TaxID=2053667 RepID=UPI003D688820